MLIGAWLALGTQCFTTLSGKTKWMFAHILTTQQVPKVSSETLVKLPTKFQDCFSHLTKLKSLDKRRRKQLF